MRSSGPESQPGGHERLRISLTYSRGSTNLSTRFLVLTFFLPNTVQSIVITNRTQNYTVFCTNALYISGYLL
uniref:Uncharacterized protein n=1 Tax=Pararge aegeria TaxID=116150 RepID=S4NN30_9NEOP